MPQVGGFTSSCESIEHIFLKSLSHKEFVKVTTCSRNELRVMTPTSVCRQAHTFSVQLKRVRNLLSFLNFFSLIQYAGAVTAMLTNPIWVVKVRMFTTRADSPTAYRSLWGKSLLILTYSNHLNA
jgi:hypothetical protein